YPPFPHHEQDPRVDQQGHVPVQRRGGDVGQSRAQVRGGQFAFAEERLHDPEPDRVQQQVRRCHQLPPRSTVSNFVNVSKNGSLLVMTTATVYNGFLTIELSPTERLLALHGAIRVPRDAITAVELLADGFAAAHGLRAPGTQIPGRRLIGTMWSRTGREFVDV